MEVSSIIPNKCGRKFNNFLPMSKGIDKQGVATRINEIQDKLKINSRSFAISIGMDPSQMSKIEKGALGISAAYASKINEVYGVNVSWILTGKGEKGVWRKIPKNMEEIGLLANPERLIGEQEERLLRIEACLEVYENAIAGLLAETKSDFPKKVGELRSEVQSAVSRRLDELRKKLG
jgi:hypothetical protein